MKEKTLIILNQTFKYGFGVMPFIILNNSKITPILKVLYLSLLSYAWYDAECFPGQEKLAKNLGVNRSTVKRQLKELKELGLIDWKRRGLNKTNIYYILEIPHELIPLKSEADGSPTHHPDGSPMSHPTIEVDEVLNKYSTRLVKENTNQNLDNLLDSRKAKMQKKLSPYKKTYSEESKYEKKGGVYDATKVL